MGGICGIVDLRRGETVEGVLKKMSDAIAHRGPAGESFWKSECICIAHRKDNVRPSVASGEQPLLSDDGRYAIACAGRIFNWETLAAEYADKTDGPAPDNCLATMLLAYQSDGTAAFARFNGGYVCAIWDRAEQSLLMVRDHFGMKPLYYAAVSGGLVFGSEIKALLRHPDVVKQPDDVGIAEFLSVNRFKLLTENTCYLGVKRLLPGTWCRFANGTVTTGRYWDIDPARHDKFTSEEERVESIRQVMVDAIRIRLPEGDCIGAALSGGFDSSSIVCVIDQLLEEQGRDATRLETFSYNFDSDEADEFHLIEVVANATRANHHALHVLQPNFFEDLDAVIAANDGPVVESTALLLYKKLKSMGDHGISVQFSGIGGDELFQGELNYFADLARQGHWYRLLREIRGVYPIDPLTGRHTELISLLRGFLLSPLRPKWLQQMRGTYNGLPYPPDWMSTDLLRRSDLGDRLPDPERPRFRNVYDQSCWDLFYYELVGASAHYHDCAGASFGIETRCPLLDVRLVEAMFATPREWKLREGRAREMQKRAMGPYLPREIIEDHVKKDHHPTVTRFMQTVLREPIQELLDGNGQMARAYLDWDKLTTHAEPFFAGNSYNPLPIWLGMALERWLQLSFGR